jgi:hypothetical protein
VLSDFTFEVKYILGPSDVFADALSCINSNKPAGVVRAESEHVVETDASSLPTALHVLSHPLITGGEVEHDMALQLAAMLDDNSPHK